MSYVLTLWQDPVPSSLADAVRIADELARRHAAPNPRFAELARALTTRYPSVETLHEDEDGVWSDGPPDGHGASAVMTLGVARSLAEVVPFVVERARQLGLTVLDPQAGRAYLPDGRALDARGAASPLPPPPSGPLADMLESKTQVLALWQEAMRPLLEPAGFRAFKANAVFKKRTRETAVQTLTDIEDFHPVQFNLKVHVSVEPVWPAPWADLARQFGADSCLLNVPALAAVHRIPLAGRADSLGALAKVVSHDDLRRQCAWWAGFMREALLPLAERCATLRGLEREFNLPESPFVAMPVGILLAAAANNPDLPAIAQRCAERVQPWFVDKAHALSAALRSMGPQP